MNAYGIIAFAGQHHQSKSGRGEQQLDDYMGSENRLRPQRSSAKPLENAAFPVNRNNGDQRKHGADRN